MAEALLGSLYEFLYCTSEDTVATDVDKHVCAFPHTVSECINNNIVTRHIRFTGCDLWSGPNSPHSWLLVSVAFDYTLDYQY